MAMKRLPSMWERFFCTSQCPICSVAELDAQQEREQTSESNFAEDSIPGIDTENWPPMNYYLTEGSPKLTGLDPWAGLGSSHQEGLTFMRGPELAPGIRGISALPSTRKRPSASVNPLSRFGFITAMFPADKYLPDTHDEVDVELARTLICLDRPAASSLQLRRLAPQRYEIDGTFVSIRWGKMGLVVREDAIAEMAGTLAHVGDDPARPDDIPLLEYLQQTASIAQRITREEHRTLTFPDACAGDRFQSMEIACKQAKLREQNAEALRRSTFVLPVQAASPQCLTSARGTQHPFQPSY
mmetsp:Transcript_84784/g.197166  ORF Transcript_84784/g.197166 Transcript_84784/m.197166 type:complete len:299 (+) Transcript_84784:64-960(+)|eukprot:CAMPEP_0171109520 /NCGR_PEP_ID=MMETSP0766_2-20121228/70827_1 /TAXON_ID=439317 /ORGANISM="Gambierdiscus australes, Strain CAWD 149" /LENGTH=298 /DNA_ID=CAMNT_0011571269 /DNA_START=59 /DNA_END=955 /DNA_ORIENTATION=+